MKKKTLSVQELDYIKHELKINDDQQIKEYKSVLLNCRIFYETIHNNSGKFQKRTDDSIVYNPNTDCFAVIKSILVVDKQLLFLVDEKFKKKIGKENCKFLKYLEEKNSQLKIMTPNLIERKFVLVKFGSTIAASEFPNLYERN